MNIDGECDDAVKLSCQNDNGTYVCSLVFFNFYFLMVYFDLFFAQKGVI